MRRGSHLIYIGSTVLCSCSDFSTRPSLEPNRGETLSGRELKVAKSKQYTEFQGLELFKQSHATKFSCKAEYLIQGDDLILKVTVKNQSGKDAIFIHHADHAGVSLLAQNRNKDEPVNPMLITYAPATMKHVKRVKKGEEFVYTEWIKFELEDRKILRFYESYGDSYIRIWDENITVNFSYGWYPDYLPAKLPAEDEKVCFKEDISARFIIKSSDLRNKQNQQ